MTKANDHMSIRTQEANLPEIQSTENKFPGVFKLNGYRLFLKEKKTGRLLNLKSEIFNNVVLKKVFDEDGKLVKIYDETEGYTSRITANAWKNLAVEEQEIWSLKASEIKLNALKSVEGRKYLQKSIKDELSEISDVSTFK
jgi:hypothetical protein